MITAALAVIGQLTDARTTEFAVKHGGKELNPLMKKVLDKYGIKGLYFVKVGVPVAFAFAGYWPLNLLIGAVGLIFGGKNYSSLKAQGFTLLQIVKGK